MTIGSTGPSLAPVRPLSRVFTRLGMAGEGAIGADIRTGLLHRIPAPRHEAIREAKRLCAAPPNGGMVVGTPLGAHPGNAILGTLIQVFLRNLVWFLRWPPLLCEDFPYHHPFIADETLHRTLLHRHRRAFSIQPTSVARWRSVAGGWNWWFGAGGSSF